MATISTSTNVVAEADSSQNKSSSSFLWKDIKAFNARLKSFHSNSGNLICCLPTAISPIICSRFGWMRMGTQQQGRNNNDNDNLSLFVACQNEEKCKGIICIKYHPQLSLESKQKLTRHYREMLATSHSQECAFRYDALSWLKQKGNLYDVVDEENILKGLVPPFLIFLSKEYEMLENYSSNTIISEYILKQAQYVSSKVFHFMQKNCDDDNNVELKLKELTRQFLNEKHLQKMTDIIDTISSSASTLSSSGSTITISYILKTILSEFNKKCNKDDSSSSNIEESIKYEKIWLKLKKLRSELTNDKIQGSTIDEKKDFSLQCINPGSLLLSIFGWRLCDDDETVGLQTEDNISSSTQFVRCNLCLNCSPVPQQFFTERKGDCCNAIDSEMTINVPPSKRRRYNSSNENEINQTGNDLNVNIGRFLQSHKFDLINSHRYYCPFVCGFHSCNELDDMGSSKPCWEIIWESILQFSLLQQIATPTTCTNEQWFNAIRNKIRASLAHQK